MTLSPPNCLHLAQEFLSFLVRAAVLRHIMHGELTDVPAAIERLVTVDVLPKIQQQHPGLAPANAFRDLACYTEQASTARLRAMIPP